MRIGAFSFVPHRGPVSSSGCPAGGADRFLPSGQTGPDLTALVRRLTTTLCLSPSLSTQPSPQTNLSGRAWLDPEGVAHLVENERIERRGPQGQLLEPIVLPRPANPLGVQPGPAGTLAYVSRDGYAVALKDGRVEMEVEVGPQARLVPLEAGGYLVGAESGVVRLSAQGQELGRVSLGERKVSDLLGSADGGVFVRTQDGLVTAFDDQGEERWTTSSPLRNFGLNSSLQLSRDGQMLFVNGAHKALVGLDVLNGQERFSLPLGKDEGYWAATPWLELENGERWILTEGGRILRQDGQGANLEPIETGARWGQINGARPSLQQSGDLVAVMPSVSSVQLFSVDGRRRASYACKDTFGPSAYFHSADFRAGQLMVAAGSFGLARLTIEGPGHPEGTGAAELRETSRTVLVGGIQVRKRGSTLPQ